MKAIYVLTLCFVMFVSFTLQSGRAEESPPLLGKGANAELLTALGNQWIETNGEAGFNACIAMYELGYAAGSGKVEDASVAADFATRIKIKGCEIKDIIAADLIYSKHGTAPNEQKYRSLIEKAATYVYFFGGSILFIPPREAKPPYKSADYKTLIDDTRTVAPAMMPDTLYQTITDVLQAEEKVVSHLQAGGLCAILSDGVRYMSDPDESKRDVELGEMYIRAAMTRTGGGFKHADVAFAFGQFSTSFEIMREDEEMALIHLRQAAENGHPESAMRAALKGPTSQQSEADIQYYLSIAALEGTSKAKELLSQSISNHGDLRSATQVRYAKAAVAEYEEAKCQN